LGSVGPVTFALVFAVFVAAMAVLLIAVVRFGVREQRRQRRGD
jgi:hypothetical protein